VGSHSRLGSAQRRSGPGKELCGLCSLCCVFPLSISLLFLFPLFAVLLNCPYPDTPVSACFCSPYPSGGRGGRVALLLPAAAKPEQQEKTYLPFDCYNHWMKLLRITKLSTQRKKKNERKIHLLDSSIFCGSCHFSKNKTKTQGLFWKKKPKQTNPDPGETNFSGCTAL